LMLLQRIHCEEMREKKSGWSEIYLYDLIVVFTKLIADSGG